MCDNAFALALASLLRPLATALHAQGKILSMDVNEHGSGYLHMEKYTAYLGAGVDRLRQMGTYGLSNTTNISHTLLDRFPLHQIGYGTCTLARYGQNTSTLSRWLKQLAAHAKRRTDPVEVDIFMLQAGTQRKDRTGVALGSAESPSSEWWPLLRAFRAGALKTDDDVDEWWYGRRGGHSSCTNCARSSAVPPGS